MKVLCISETLGRGGGAEQLIFALAPHFKSLGVEVHYLALFPYEDDLGVVMQEEGYTVFRAGITRPWQLLSGCARITRVVNLRDYDVLWGHLYFGNLYANLLNITTSTRKTIISLHSEGYAQLPSLGIKAHVSTAIERLVCSRANAKYAVSSAVKKDYEDFFGWRGLGIIHNGVDTSAIGSAQPGHVRDSVRQAHGVTEDDFFVVVPARFVKKKGHTYLIQAIKLLRDEGYRICAYFASAQGPERDVLVSEIMGLGMSEHIKLSDATVPHERLLELIKASDAVVIPSLREPFGIAAAEAMACGTPTVLTKVDGFCELVGQSGAAMMVPPGKVDELADAVRVLVTDLTARHLLAQKGRQRVQEFDIRKCAKLWVAAFNSLLCQHSKKDHVIRN